MIPEDLHPEPMLRRPAPPALPLPPDRDRADPSQYHAQFVALSTHEEAFGCPCCGTRAYAVMRTPVSEHRITERNVVVAMHQLALANAMPPLSRYWQTRTDYVYGQSYADENRHKETGRTEKGGNVRNLVTSAHLF